ncbi:MAG: ABC transporter permease, partial [Bacteroidetes bacterium]|nr:ABC transporter permease [Bacteroidota bacterium]
MGLRENIKLALRAIRANLLRTILTVCIIALGISMIVGILTCIDVVEASLTTNFTRMGANTFTIRNIRMQNRGDNSVRINPPIGYDQATDFEKRYDFPSVVSISTRAT